MVALALFQCCGHLTKAATRGWRIHVVRKWVVERRTGSG
jgi:hypothetical protein